MIYDVIIVGAGVSGSSIARELSKYDLNVCVLEKGEDVCSGTSKANSAIVHAGFDAPTGTLMAKLNVKGNGMMDQVAADLDVPFKRNGAFVVCLEKDGLPGLQKLYDRGIANGVPAESMEILTGDEARKIEPNLSDRVAGAFWAKTSGIVCPFILNIAMAENANVNGVDFFFNTKVEEIRRMDGGKYWELRTNNGMYKANYVINAAGVHADELHNMVSRHRMHITPRRGDYVLLDKAAGDHVSRTIFQQPTKMGKGVLVTPTVHGNLLVGPTAIDIDDPEGTNTTAAGLDEVMTKASSGVKDIPFRQVITSFAGLRAHEDGDDFIIEEAADAPHFIDCAGMQSPGLSASPAVGPYVVDEVLKKSIQRDADAAADGTGRGEAADGNRCRPLLSLNPRKNWNGKRRGILHPSELSLEERNELIRKEPAYGRIICRCESITEGEILDAIHRPLGARSLDGVKRRTRAGMGRCQTGFCSPRVMDILHRELGMPYEEITKSGGESKLVVGRTKNFEKEEDLAEEAGIEKREDSELTGAAGKRSIGNSVTRAATAVFLHGSDVDRRTAVRNGEKEV